MRTNTVDFAVRLIALAALGCQTQTEAVCEALCACRECSEPQQADCEQRIDLLIVTSDDTDCEPPREALLDCMEQSLECVEAPIVSACGPQKAAVEACVGLPVCVDPTETSCPDAPAE